MKEKILSWNEIYRAAEGKGFGDIELNVYNNARGCIENYALEHFGIDIKNEEIPEEAIDTFLSEHSELDQFNETGQMVANNTAKKMENKTMNNETLLDKYNRMEKFFEGKYCNDFRKGDSFAQLYESVKKEFPNKTFPSWTDEKVLENAVSRIIYENIDFNLFSPDNYDVVYNVTDGYDQRCEVSDKLAELLITDNIKFKDFNSLKDFLPNIEKPLLKEIKDNNPDIQVTDRINSAFNVASRLYPGIESSGNKKAYIEKAFDSLKTDYEEKILNNELEFFELEALVKGIDAVRDGEKSLSYIRPSAEEMQTGSEEDWGFDEFTKGYALFQNPDSTIKGGVTPKFISKLDSMDVFKTDGAAAEQWKKDTGGHLLKERTDMWIGDEDLEYYSYPDTPENRAILKENGWLLERPLKFDFSEFTENDFYKIKNELLKDRPNEDYYGRLHIGSLHVEFVINQPDGWVDTNYYILAEKGEGEAQFGVPYDYFPGNQFIANLFTDNTYEEFKEKVSKAVLEYIATVGILKTEAMRPLVDWSDEKQCKELYRTKLVESARENEIVIAPYSQDRRDMEAVRDFIAKIDGVPAATIQDDAVRAVIDNIGKVQDSEAGDFLKLRKDGTMEHISALGHVEKEPLEILSIINSFAENHAAVSEEHSQQKKDYEKISSLYKKASEKHMHINGNGFNPSEYVLNKLKEKGIEVISDKEVFDRILLRENNLQKMAEKLTEEQRRRYFTFDEEDIKKFEEHIKEWQKDNTNPSKLIVVGKTTPVMKILGISEKLIEVEQSTLDKMTGDIPVYPNDKQGHKLSADDIYAIPSQLADPVMVFKSRTRNDSFVFFTERKDSGNHSILIPLAVDKRKGRIVIHEITSMYGKDNEIDFVKTNIDENNLVYEDRKRSCLWAKEKIEELEKQNIKDAEKNKSSNGGRFTQIQFLGQRFTDNGTYIFNILTKERLVNFISSQNPKKRTPVQKMSLSPTEPYNIESLFVSKNEANLDSEIDKLTEKDVSLKDDFITISEKTPFIFKEFGLDDFPVNMYKQKLARALFLEEEKFGERRTHGHKGEFTEQEVKDVFKNISNPRYIFNSKQDLNNPDNFYLVGVYDVMGKQGNPMVLSFHFDKNRRQVEANWVTSVYGKRIISLVNDWTKKGYLVYRNDLDMEKAPKEVVTLHMRVSTSSSAYKDNIKRKSDYVNDMDLLFSKRNENVYGFTYEGKIYLNPDVMDADSAVHEYTHLWDNLTRKDNPELWNKGLKIFKGTSLWNEVINDSHYQDIKDDENLVLSECHARICGRVADSVLNHIAELDGNEKQAEMIDWDKETIDFIFENYRDIFAGSSFNSVAEFTASAMKNLFSPVRERDSYSESVSIIKEQLEKESGITVNERVADEIYSKYKEHDLVLKPEKNGSFRSYDNVDGKYTNPFSIGEALEQVLAWNEKELSELYAGTADDKEISKIKEINEELEHISSQIACNKQLQVLCSDDKKSIEQAMKLFEESGLEVTEKQAEVLINYSTNFNDGTSQYAVNRDRQLYFKTDNDKEGWSFITDSDHDYGKEILLDALEHAAVLLEPDNKDDVCAFREIIKKNRTVLEEENFQKSGMSSARKLESILKETGNKAYKVTESVTFPCGFTFPKEIYENDTGEIKREEYRWKIYKKIKEKFGFHDNDSETEYFRGNTPSGSSFNISFAVPVPSEIKADTVKVNEWVESVEKFVKDECGCTFINWQGGERIVQVYENEKQYRMEEEKINDYVHLNVENFEYASAKDIQEYCRLNSRIELTKEQSEEIERFYKNNTQFSLYVSPAGNLYERDEYYGNLLSADAELLNAGNHLRSLERKERLEYLLKNTSVQDEEFSKVLFEQISSEPDKKLKILSEVLADSFETLDRHDEFWKALLDYGANPKGAIRIVASDANLSENLNWLLDNVPENQLNQIFADKNYADDVFDIAKESVSHDMDSWIGEQDICFEGLKRIACLCEREKDADLYYAELLKKAFGKAVELKEPVEIVKEIAKEKEILEVPEVFKTDFKNKMINSVHKDPFILTKSILNEWKSTKPEYIPVLNEWLKQQGCTTKEGFENFFKKISSHIQKKSIQKDKDIGVER